MPERRGDVTELLAQWAQGDRAALNSVAPLVYAELRKIADSYLRRERTGHTLQPTALVNEAWLRLVKQDHANFPSRKHFYALAAQMMRQILVDHARTLRAEKRGGGVVKEPLNEAVVSSEDRAEDMLALDQALTELARHDARKAQIIELRYFGGLTVSEVAEVLGVSIATVSREQRTAEAYLSQAMSNRTAEG